MSLNNIYFNIKQKIKLFLKTKVFKINKSICLQRNQNKNIKRKIQLNMF